MWTIAELKRSPGKFVALAAQVPRPPQPKQGGAEGDRPAPGCRTMCLGCDARDPCTLGRLFQ